MKINSLTIPNLVLAMLVIVLLSACSSDSDTKIQSEAILARPAKLLVVGPNSDKKYLNYPAIIQSQQFSKLSFEVGGVLQKIYVTEAQKVKQGDPLAALDQRDLQTKLDAARAQYNNADTEYQRAVRLYKEDAISRSELEQRKSKWKVNRAQFEEAKKGFQDSILTAPHDGHISKVYVREKEVMQRGDVAIGILGYGGLEATVNLPSRIMAMGRTQGKGNEHSYIVLDVAPKLQIPIIFKEASLEADSVTQTFGVTFTFDSPDGLNVLPGMNATVWFRGPINAIDGADQIWVPLAAIANDGNQQYVWIVDTKTMFTHRRDVEIEPGVGVELAISSGLKAGDTIVVSGISTLSEGMLVRQWAE